MPVTIKGELYSSKNSRQIYRPNNSKGKKPKFRVVKSDLAKRQEIDFGFQLNTNRNLWNRMVLGASYPLRISFKIYRTTRRPFDYTNIVQGLLDAMVRAGYIEDDSAKFVIPVFEQYEVDKNNPRTIITVL